VFILSSIGIGLVLHKLDNKLFMVALYVSIVALALVSVPYDLLFIGSLVRLSGPLRQPDFLAAWLGCGLLIGLFAYRWYPRYSKAILAAQGLLLVTLLLTETRAIIGLVLLLTLVYLWIFKKAWKFIIGAVIITCVLFVPFIHTKALHSTTHILQQDVLLRVHIQSVAIQSFKTMPFQGYGPGNIVNVLACAKLTSPDLVAVCNRHLEYTSSHNIFIDRLLEFGWLGGLTYIALTVYAITRGFRSQTESGRALSFCMLLLGFYYLTNITSTEVELLFWVLLIAALFTPRFATEELKI